MTNPEELANRFNLPSLAASMPSLALSFWSYQKSPRIVLVEAGLDQDDAAHEVDESFGQFTFHHDRIDSINGYRATSTGSVHNKRFRATFYHTKRTCI